MQDLFIVLEGELVRSVERDGVRSEIGTVGKGGVVGTTEFFARPSSEDVEIDSPSRLMRFTAADLERLAKRYPRSGAIINRNLNRIQAERLATLLDWLAVEKRAQRG